MWLTLILVAVVLLCYLIYYKRQRDHRILNECGIPGPDPHWFYGNLKGITMENPLILKIHEWSKQYGKVYGYYEGPQPNIVTSDPDMVQELFVRRFSHFHGRKRFPFQEDPNKTKRASMFVAEGERWKRLRTIVNPAFTETKMRMMFPLIKHCVDQLMDMLQRQSAEGKPVDIYEYYKRMTLDVIAQCAFGVDLDTQNKPGNRLFASLKKLFDEHLVKRSWVLVLAQAMPEVRPLVSLTIRVMSKVMPSRKNQMFLLDEMKTVIQQRRENPELRRVDILQMLLDAEVDDVDKARENSNNPKPKALTTIEIQEQVMLFLFAGYETSSTALAYITHCLAMYPDVQERLKAEVDEVYEELGEDAETSYERLGNMQYMNNVIYETLRFYPIAPSVIARRCSNTIKVGDYTIPEGGNIMVDVYSLHFNPDLWGPIDPNVYDPDRFEGNPKRHPAAWIPFGVGPRFCVGQRFALMEIRATLLRVIHRYKIKPCSETASPIKLKYGPTITPKGELKVILEERS